MDIIPQNIHWLIPEEPVPCDIYLHFRGKSALGMSAGQNVSIAFLEKLAKAEYSHIYVRKQDLPTWQQWTAKRHPAVAGKGMPDDSAESSKLYGNKRAEYLSYIQKSVHLRNDEDKDARTATTAAFAVIKKTVNHAMLDWYFQQFHEPPDLFFHSARVAYPLAAFCFLHHVADVKDIENLTFATVIHELSGDPRESLKTVVSEQTLAKLEEEKQPVPAEVIGLIRLQDELFSGKGFPGNKKKDEIPPALRAFSLFNHFDHYRLAATGTRRARFDQARQKMEARRADYDPDLWDAFWKFWETSLEAIS